ncbi:MAG: hypothetical protein ACHQKY_16750 [Terriglobia bacterium]
MRQIARGAFFVSLLFILSVSIFTQNSRGPSTPEERATAVRGAHLLESDPFNPEAKKIRQWFTLWLIQIPDITVQMCTDYLRPVYEAKDKNYSTEIAIQMTFSSAAFIIEHPDQASDKIAVNLAGLEGSLKAYESVLKVKPKAKSEFLDGLIAKREKGELKAYVEEVAKTKCKGKS